MEPSLSEALNPPSRYFASYPPTWTLTLTFSHTGPPVRRSVVTPALLQFKAQRSIFKGTTVQLWVHCLPRA